MAKKRSRIESPGSLTFQDLMWNSRASEGINAEKKQGIVPQQQVVINVDFTNAHLLAYHLRLFFPMLVLFHLNEQTLHRIRQKCLHSCLPRHWGVESGLFEESIRMSLDFSEGLVSRL